MAEDPREDDDAEDGDTPENTAPDAASGATADVQEQAFIRQLTAELYGNMKRLAQAQRRRFRASETLQTTALVSEAYLKLIRNPGWRSREHFLNTAAMVMRQVLVDYARSRLTAKRGGGQEQSLDTIDEVELVLGQSSEQVLSIDLALTRLAELEPRLAKIVEYRFFAGYGDDECASLLNISPRTVQRDWLKARAWLFQELDPPAPG